MSKLMKRYEKEKFEKNLPKEKITTKQIITLIMSFLFLSSILFIIYIINQDIDIINLVKIAEPILKNPPLLMGGVMFIFVFIFGILLTNNEMKNRNHTDISDVIINFVAIIITAFIFSVFFYFVIYIVTFRWV